jgi:hypothetical protein
MFGVVFLELHAAALTIRFPHCYKGFQTFNKDFRFAKLKQLSNTTGIQATSPELPQAVCAHACFIKHKQFAGGKRVESPLCFLMASSHPAQQ